MMKNILCIFLELFESHQSMLSNLCQFLMNNSGNLYDMEHTQNYLSRIQFDIDYILKKMHNWYKVVYN